MKKFKELRFGTSGLRDTVENMTDMECYINSRGFLAFLSETGEFTAGGSVALGGDRRPSTPLIKRAVAAAVRDRGGTVDDQGLTSSPALALYAMSRGIPSIMVTGSHIPADRNGIKFTKRSGEILKSDEKPILANVAAEREKVYAMPPGESPFDENAMFTESEARKADPLLSAAPGESRAMREYVARYADVFAGTPFPEGTRIFLYQHSAVARDVIKEIFESLGAEVIAPDTRVALDYVDDTGAAVSEDLPLRSAEFVPVDTESVSSQTMAVFQKKMNELGCDFGITMDGDSDRPLLVYHVFGDAASTDGVAYVTGDILGLMTVLALEGMGVAINAVAVPVSANDAIAKVLEGKGVEITSTKIGSPYVIAAMNESLSRHPGSVWNVFSWESNGGFLTGTDLTINGKVLTSLPTRDAALPLLSVILSARTRGVSIEAILNSLPARFTHADRKKDFPTEKSAALIAVLSPSAGGVSQLDFTPDGKAVAALSDGGTARYDEGSEFHKIRDLLSRFFSPADGFSGIAGINYIDGVRILFTNGEISHLRPSGNAPEFRNYAIAGSPERAREIVEIGLNKIIPEMAKELS